MGALPLPPTHFPIRPAASVGQLSGGRVRAPARISLAIPWEVRPAMHKLRRPRPFVLPVVFLIVAALVVAGIAIWLDTYAERLVARNPPTDPPAFPGTDEPYDRSGAAALPSTVAAYEATFGPTFGQWILGVVTAVLLAALVVLALVTWRLDVRRR